ncbi:hypothetical protein Bca4012_025049 [Brassica carinata]
MVYQKFHAFMFPWLAFGHMIPYLHLANKLAEKGHRVTFLLPKKAQKQLEHHNLFPDNIAFHPLTIPPVDGLPAGAETSSDIPLSLGKFLSAAMDLTRDQVEAAVRALRPDLILFDFAYWVTEIAKEHRVKSVLYSVVSATTIAHNHVPVSELGVPPPGYPSSKVLYRAHDAHALSSLSIVYKRIYHRMTTDKSKPLEDQWSSWLTGFGPGSVVFCALGSQITLEKDQFQELCLGMELTGLPFLVAQPLILAHPSVGCFVLNTRLMTEELEVSVEVLREETGWFSRESLSAAIISVMDKDSELGNLVRRNHAKLKEILVSPGLLTGYTDKFVQALQDLVSDTNLE